LYQEKAMHDSAIAVLRAYADTGSGNSDIFLRLGDSYACAGSYRLSLQNYSNALKAEPLSTEAKQKMEGIRRLLDESIPPKKEHL
jgi:cytochrome c-type biogenesis protein CcmH/NrfG